MVKPVQDTKMGPCSCCTALFSTSPLFTGQHTQLDKAKVSRLGEPAYRSRAGFWTTVPIALQMQSQGTNEESP